MNSDAQGLLVSILEDGVDVHRCAAARALGRIGSPGAATALTKALLDEDPDVRTDAAAALLKLNDPATAGPLMESLLGDPEPDVKTAALKALVGFRHPPVLELLRRLAVSRSDEVSWDEDEFFSEGWDSWLDIQLLAIDGLAEFGAPETALDVLAAMADEMGQDVSETGVAALARMGQEGAEALSGLFDICDPQLRRRIAEAVVVSDNPHTGALVEKMLNHEAAQIRRIAALGLDPADPRLEKFFGDADPDVRAAAVSHAGRAFPTEVAALVVDSEPMVRTEVFKLIAAEPELFPGKELRGKVQKAITGDPGAARHAALALVALRGPVAAKGLAHTMSNPRIPLDFRIGAVEAMRQAGPSSVPYLLKAVGDEERQLRLAAMTALAGFAASDPAWPNAAGEALLAALDGKLVEAPEEEEAAEPEPLAEEATDAAAAEEKHEIDNSTPLVAEPADAGRSTLAAIVSGGSPAVAEPVEPTPLGERELRLLDLAKKRNIPKRKVSLDFDVAPHLDVRRFAANLLGEVANPEVTGKLIEALADGDPEIEEAALTSLVQHAEQTGSLPQDTLDPLSRCMASQASNLRVLALRALASVGDAGAEAILRAHLGDEDPLVRAEAVRGLGNRGIADDEVEACLKDSYLGVGIAAATSLARNRGDAAAAALVDFAFLHDGTYRQDVGRLLGAHARHAGAARLTEVLRDADQRRNWLVAIDALAELLALSEPPPELKVA